MKLNPCLISIPAFIPLLTVPLKVGCLWGIFQKHMHHAGRRRVQMPNPPNQIWNLFVLSDIDILYQHLRFFLGVPGTEYLVAYSSEESNV